MKQFVGRKNDLAGAQLDGTKPQKGDGFDDLRMDTRSGSRNSNRQPSQRQTVKNAAHSKAEQTPQSNPVQIKREPIDDARFYDTDASSMGGDSTATSIKQTNVGISGANQHHHQQGLSEPDDQESAEGDESGPEESPHNTAGHQSRPLGGAIASSYRNVTASQTASTLRERLTTPASSNSQQIRPAHHPPSARHSSTKESSKLTTRLPFFYLHSLRLLLPYHYNSGNRGHCMLWPYRHAPIPLTSLRHAIFGHCYYTRNPPLPQFHPFAAPTPSHATTYYTPLMMETAISTDIVSSATDCIPTEPSAPSVAPSLTYSAPSLTYSALRPPPLPPQHARLHRSRLYGGSM